LVYYRESGGETDAKRHGMQTVRIVAILIAVVASSGSIVDAVTYAEPSENDINAFAEIHLNHLSHTYSRG
jgi:hypothetical protein